MSSTLLKHFHRTISTPEDNGKIEMFARITIKQGEKDSKMSDGSRRGIENETPTLQDRGVE